MAATVNGAPVLSSGAFTYIANLLSDGAATAGVAFNTSLTDATLTPTEIQIVPTNAGGVGKFYISTLPTYAGGKWTIAVGTLAGAGTDACRLVVRYPHSIIQ
jgi:hypothetical protein